MGPIEIQATAAAISGLALIASMFTLVANLRGMRKMKTIDLMRSFQERYDKLRWDIAKDVKDEQTAGEFFSRFWNIQLEQYEFWQQGLIDDRIYTYWMRLRRAEHNDQRPFLFTQRCPTPTYRDGWDSAMKGLKTNLHTFGTFQVCMERILQTTQDIPTILRESKQRKWFMSRMLDWV